LVLFLISLAILIFFWEWSVDSGHINVIFFSKPSAIFNEFLNLVQSGELFKHLNVTLQEVVLGFTIGAFVGVFIGAMLHWNQTLTKILLPYIHFLYSTPYVAIVPLIMFWFGIGILFKIISVILAVFPILALQTYEGARTVDKDFINLLRSMKFSNYQIVKKVTFPTSLFFIFTGLRLGFGRAMMIALVAEFQASSVGIGYLIQYSSNTFNTATLLVGVLVVSFISVLVIRLLMIVEKHFMKWYPQNK
jgi:ABC-type nitrate/sulfonate/bicarbonate transport system permease component